MRLQKWTRACAALLALLLLTAIPAPARAESFRAIITSGSMRVYADSSLRRQIGTLPGATIVTVESYSNGSALISLGGARGYAAVSDMAAMDSLAKPVTFNTNSRVYRQPNLSSDWLGISAGMQVNLLATNGQWAMVENAGIIAYTNKDHLTRRGAAEQPEPEAPQEDAEIVFESFSAEVTSQMMFIYDAPSAASNLLGGLPRGQVVTVRAYNSAGWAYIELNGHGGFAQYANMARAAEPEAPQVPDDYMTSGDYSVEQVIFLFLTREMELNTAVACGILANVERECSFKVTNASHDGGYGICQWTGVRNTRLKNWCKSNDYDYTTLEGQLWYLKYELETHHPKTLRYLRGVENTADGAYDAAYYFCYNFEVPASRASRSVERGNIAKDKYWERYAV